MNTFEVVTLITLFALPVVIIAILRKLLVGEWPGIWTLCVRAARGRYCLLTIVAPVGVALFGTSQAGHSLVYGVIVLRSAQDDGFAQAADVTSLESKEISGRPQQPLGGQYFSDLSYVTVLSFLTVAFGLASLRICNLYGDLRIRSPKQLIGEMEPLAEPENPRRVWDWKYHLAWLVFGIGFPLTAAVVSHREAPKECTIVLGAQALACGFGISILILWILGVAQRYLLGTAAPPCGLLPFEGSSVVREGPPTKFQTPINYLFAGDSFTAWLLRGPGYTRKNGELLPGHAQMFICAIASAVVYTLWYCHSIYISDWTVYKWPAAFYVLVLIFVLGWQLSCSAFWLDRYGIPPTIIVMAWTATVYSLGHSDHFFSLNLNTAEVPLPGNDARPNSVTAEPKSAIQNLLGIDDFKNHLTYRQPTFIEAFDGWNFPKGTDGKRTMVIVAASGGGIQAAAWTAQVLTELDKEIPGFSESVGAISAVSGGSVGTLYYLAHRGARTNNDQMPMAIPDETRQTIVMRSAASSLEAVSWGVSFPDLVRTVFPPFAPPLHDRGWALESSWWNRMGNRPEDRLEMESIRIRDLIPAIRRRQLPPVIFNATVVETGQRVLISPVSTLKVTRKAGAGKPEDDVEKRNYSFLTNPIDFVDFYTVDGHCYPNPSLSTAVRLSASFSYVAPVAKPAFGDRSTVGKATYLPQHEREDHERRCDLHYCDGGYADNAGLTTAIRLIDDLVEYYSSCVNEDAKFQLPFQRIVLIRIEAFPPDRAGTARSNSGFLSSVFGPNTALATTRVSTQAERGEIEVGLLQRSTRNRINENAVRADAEIQSTLRLMETAIKTLVELLKSIKKNSFGLISFEEYTDALLNASKVDPLQRIEIWRTQINAIANDARFKVIPGMNHIRFDPLSTELEKLHDALDREAGLANKRIEVHSLTFRFAKGLLPEAASDAGAHDTPPLSWTLTQSQKKDIRDVWASIWQTEQTGPDTHHEDLNENESGFITIHRLKQFYQGAPAK